MSKKFKDYLNVGPLSDYEEEIEAHIIAGKRELEMAYAKLVIIQHPIWKPTENILDNIQKDLSEFHFLNKTNRLCQKLKVTADEWGEDVNNKV